MPLAGVAASTFCFMNILYIYVSYITHALHKHADTQSKGRPALGALNGPLSGVSANEKSACSNFCADHPHSGLSHGQPKVLGSLIASSFVSQCSGCLQWPGSG